MFKKLSLLMLASVFVVQINAASGGAGAGKKDGVASIGAKLIAGISGASAYFDDNVDNFKGSTVSRAMKDRFGELSRTAILLSIAACAKAQENEVLKDALAKNKRLLHLATVREGNLIREKVAAESMDALVGDAIVKKLAALRAQIAALQAQIVALKSEVKLATGALSRFVR